ncbi:UDP-glucosyltransferase 2-like [Topomyia yanbarensis]|uniref:UDP-glucosyltransferase 2-like n=1 Tax=Topomyia yanbarensis TaxID=2498891 RepID=UPI00273B2CFA|nr:UDP-glucosyltransferase 2-like [Topomyia yanbarensis]
MKASLLIKVICTFCPLVLFGFAETSRILCIDPSPGKSHVLVAQALLKGLAERGHEITMVSPFKLSKPVKNFREIVVPLDDFISSQMKKFLEKPPNILTELPSLVNRMLVVANDTVNHPDFLELKKEKFDLVIAGLFVADFILGYGPHFEAPTVVLWTAGISKFTSEFVGNPREIAASPNMMLGKQDFTKFSSRLKNFLVACVEDIIGVYTQYKQKPYYDWNFPSGRYPSYEDVRKNVSLLLLNSHFSHGGARPYLQNAVEVGGLQIKTKPDPLPKDIQEWLDGADKHGAIYFCLGSNLKSTDLPAHKMEIFVKSLGKLKQRILWKWEADSFPNQPANVMTKKWLPQDDVLAHKNVVLFVAHGGLGGIAEARYHGVPVLGIPIFAEQSGNVANVVREGWGLEVNYETMNETTFSELLNEMLTNPIYRQKAKEISTVYRDRPQTAMETACYWIEYVIRHKGAVHMHYQGADLNFFQSHMLDVIAVILVAVYLVIKVLKVACKGVARLFGGGKPKKQKQY